MRLPWPFRPAQRSPAGSEAAPSGNGASPPRGEKGAWRRLPPLGETIGPPPLVAPARPFAEALAASNPPPAALQPLSHGHSLEAPRGIVVGVARPTAAPSGPGLPKAVQRSPMGRRSTKAAGPDETTEVSPAPEPGPPPVPVGSSTPTPAPAVSEPVRRLSVASDVVRAAPKPLTVASLPVNAGPRPGTIGQARSAGSAPAHAPELARSPEPAAAVQRGPVELAPTPAAAPSDAPRMTLGQARRLGLGAPIGGGPVVSGVPRPSSIRVAAPTRPPGAALAASAPAGIQRAPIEPTAAGIDMRLASQPSIETPTEPGRAPATDAGFGPSPAAHTGGRGPSSVGPSVGPSVRPARASASRPQRRESPLVSANALGTGSQRAPLTIPSGVQRSPAGQTGAAPTPGGKGVRIHRGAAAGEIAGALQARSFTHGGEIYMPDNHGPLTSGTGKALLAHEMTHVVQQRRLGSSLPSEQTSHGRTLEAEAVRAERSPDMPLATHQPSSPATTATSTTTAQAMPDLPPASGASQPKPQRAPADGGGSSAMGAGKGGSGHTHTEQELEVLAHQLYHRIGRHLRRELLVDRERLGFALDLP